MFSIVFGAKGEIFDYDKFQRNLRGNEAQTDVSALYLDNGYLTFNVEAEEKRVAEDSIDIFIRVILIKLSVFVYISLADPILLYSVSQYH